VTYGDALDLARYMAWADAAVWKAALGSDASAGDPALLDTLHHLHTVQHAFPQMWKGETLEVLERSSFREATDLARWGREGHARVAAYLERASPSDLAREFQVPWSRRVEELTGQAAQPLTVEESLTQVVLHTQHHRGQACTRLRELGGTPPTIDYIYWIWLGRPAAEWSLPGV
jgi:uncharacterized damage-inducible protein DinB